jgi:hypothetical protein
MYLCTEACFRTRNELMINNEIMRLSGNIGNWLKYNSDMINGFCIKVLCQQLKSILLARESDWKLSVKLDSLAV